MDTWRRVATAFDEDMDQPQLRLPFPDEKTIDMARCCAILHVVPHVVRRLMVTPLEPESDVMSLVGYNTMRWAPMRIDYQSLVRFLDTLRIRHGIPDRRPTQVFGRYRDDDLLPFPWSDTISSEDAADVLSIHRTKVLLRIEAGQFEAYQLVRSSPWRISRSSLARLVASFGAGHASTPGSARPYGGGNPRPLRP
jgi:hypothetical protein